MALSPCPQSPTVTPSSMKAPHPPGQAACSIPSRRMHIKNIYKIYINTHINTYQKPPYGDPDKQSRADHHCPTPMNSSLGKHQARLENFASASPRKYPAGPEPSPGCSELCRAEPCRAAGSLRPGPASRAIKSPRRDGSPRSWIGTLGLSCWHRQHLISAGDRAGEAAQLARSRLEPAAAPVDAQPCCPGDLGDHDASSPVNRIPSADGPEDATGMLPQQRSFSQRGFSPAEPPDPAEAARETGVK